MLLLYCPLMVRYSVKARLIAGFLFAPRLKG